MPLDIFIPYWGDPGYLKETVRSVLAQDSGDWRLTVVDDAYPDLTVKEYFDGIDDERITYIRKEQNEGITANYRTCVSLATQDLMTILGCDDVLLSTRSSPRTGGSPKRRSSSRESRSSTSRAPS
jgi:glycosyltransferase involved in cell wall biosynthesis